VLTRSDLVELGYERRAVDAIFREIDVVALPGATRPVVPRRRVTWSVTRDRASLDDRRIYSSRGK
jgi:hypothetical protein